MTFLGENPPQPLGIREERLDHSYKDFIKSNLKKKYLFPPFTVFNAREGDWQKRKKEWISLGIKSELGRGEDHGTRHGTLKYSDQSYDTNYKRKPGGLLKYSIESVACLSRQKITDEVKKNLTYVKNNRNLDDLDPISKKILEVAGGGTSVFDPVLCEVMYRWFVPQGGLILDPFAGGSVRGIVATKCKRKYCGIDLSENQILENRNQADNICKNDDYVPEWIIGNSIKILPNLNIKADFIFSCPPYGNLEVYSNNPEDLSFMEYDEFLTSYFKIISESVKKLNDNRFACFVVGDYRNKQGNYTNFVSNTIKAFEDAGMFLYNEAILITQTGSLAIRVMGGFDKSRKLGKTHQNVLIFIKGDSKKATLDIGEVIVDNSWKNKTYKNLSAFFG